MTDRATFGDCATAAGKHLGTPVLSPLDLARATPSSMMSVVRDYNYGLHRVLKAMTRYLPGILNALHATEGSANPSVGPWLRASAEARDAALNALACSPQLNLEALVHAQLRTGSRVTRQLDAAALAMAAGRDLLLTHYDTLPDRSLQPRSGWVPVIESIPANQALLTTVAGWARQIAAEGTYLTSSPVLHQPEAASERHRLDMICQHLSVLVSVVDTAQREAPFNEDAIAQMNAVPGNFLQPQRIPARTETISGLCRGLTESAERVRHAFMTAIPDAAWSPEMSAESFSRTAVYATAISHHCQMVQRSLATRTADLGARGLSPLLTAAADSSARASQAWMRAAQRWYHVKTDAISETSPAAAEAADLMIWTGRLAHSDPDWTPTLGPSHAPRAPHELAPEANDIGDVMAAIHQASTTLTSIAAADYERVRIAAQTGRLLVPAIETSKGRYVDRPFARASKQQGESLLGAYGRAGTTSVKAAAKTATVIAEAPKHGTRRNGTAPIEVERNMPGPVERRLIQLGVTSSEVLERGEAIDRSARQLISEAAQETAPQRWHTAVAGQKAVADTSKITRQLLAPPGPRRSSPRRLPDAARPDRELEAGR